MTRSELVFAWAVCMCVGCGAIEREPGPVRDPRFMDATTPPPPPEPPGPPPTDVPDQGLQPQPGDAGPQAGTEPGAGLVEAWSQCGDREPEPDALTDCASPSCATAPICCADSEACCVAGATSLSIAFDGCTGAADDPCLDELDLLGGVRPTFVPDGDGAALWLASEGPTYVAAASRTRFDPTHAIDATLSLASVRACAIGACQEMTGIGLARDDATSPEEAELAAVLSAATHQLLLLSHGEVIRRAPVDLSVPTAGALTIAVDATGQASARFVADGGGPVTLTTRLGALPPVALRAVAFGRGDNASSATLVVRAMTATTRVCDRPSAWVIAPVAVSNARTLPSPWTSLAVADGTGASGPERRFVLTAGDRAYVGVLTEDGSVALTTDDGGAIVGEYLDGTPPSEQVGGLVYSTSDARWELYASRGGADIVRIPSYDGERFERSSAQLLLDAARVPAVAIDQPAVAIDFRGYTTVAFRARGEDGRTWIGSMLDLRDGAPRLDEDFVAPSEGAAGFDRDGVESPSVAMYGELTHLYYVGRRGVSRTIGLVRRTALGGWQRYAGAGEVLATGDEPWRNFGVAAPAVALTPSETSATLDVYFIATGTEGESLRRAHRDVPWRGH